MHSGSGQALHAGVSGPRLRVVTFLAATVSAAALLAGVDAAGSQEEPLEPRPPAESAQRLFQRDCAVCHGPRGGGTSDGPSIEESGTAAVHFMLTTGYMPLEDPEQETFRRPPAYSDAQIAALVDYVDQFTSGPEVPDVTVDEDAVARGGELFRLHCAACHQFVGTGGILVGAEEAPTLHHATTVEVVEALRVGPGTMPAFSEDDISPDGADAIASFVDLVVREPGDPGGVSLGHFGPWSEGFVAWFVGLGALLVLAGWIGKRA